MSVLVHLSDLHFGPSYVSHLGETILAEMQTIKPDAVVISGDLTLRARHREFKAARDFLSRIPYPLLTVPGNHDQTILNPLERLVSPLARYRKHIHPRLNETLTANGFFVVGLNDNRPILPGGFWSPEQYSWLGKQLSAAPRGAVRVIATHHQFVWDRRFKPAGFWRPSRALGFLARHGVELVLNGHTHIPSAKRSPEGIVIARASTATCARTRDGQGNGYNLITTGDSQISIFFRRYDPNAQKFLAAQALTFDRGVLKSGGAGEPE